MLPSAHHGEAEVGFPSAYGGGVLSVYFSIDDVHRTTFFVLKTKWRLGFPIIKTDKRNNVYC
jgi:hypothetical protein